MYMTCSIHNHALQLQQVVTQSYVLSIWEEPGPKLSARRAGDGGGGGGGVNPDPCPPFALGERGAVPAPGSG